MSSCSTMSALMVYSESSVCRQTLFSDLTAFVSQEGSPAGNLLVAMLLYFSAVRGRICAGFPYPERTIVKTTYTQSPPATHDPCKNAHIDNHSLSLTATTTITSIHHRIELTGNRDIRRWDILPFFFLRGRFGKIPWEATCYVYFVLLAHTCTLLNHRPQIGVFLNGTGASGRAAEGRDRPWRASPKGLRLGQTKRGFNREWSRPGTESISAWQLWIDMLAW